MGTARSHTGFYCPPWARSPRRCVAAAARVPAHHHPPTPLTRSDTHLECYADRILYIRDGRIEAQQINARQTPLDAEAHADFLASEGGKE